MRKLFNEFCREENIQTWVPILSSFCGIFCSPLIGQALDNYPRTFWIFFGISIICGILFFALSVKYLKKWHSIISLLRKGNDDHLLEIATYVATTESIKQRNSSFSLTEVKISYLVESFDSQKKKYALRVRYDVTGYVTQKMSSVDFYMLARKTTSDNPTVEYYFGTGKKNFKQANKAEERSGITHYTLSDHETHEPGKLLHYTISIFFPAERGLSLYANQRFLFDPQNFSVDCRNAQVEFCASLPEEAFNIPQVDVFTDGLNRNRDCGPYSLKAKPSKTKHTYKVYQSTKLDAEAGKLYAVVFSPKDTSTKT